MKRKPAELKRFARETLTGHYGIPMGAIVLSWLIMVLIMMPFSIEFNESTTVTEWVVYCIAEIAVSLLGVIFEIGVLRILLNMARKKPYAFQDLFFGFHNHPDRYILASLRLFAICLIPMIPFLIVFAIDLFWYELPLNVSWIAAVLTMLVMLVGEVILQIRYAMIYFLLLDNPDMGVREAFRASAELMQGNMGRFFYLCLTFVGWFILGVMSLGIGLLWIEPYMRQTITYFYLDVSKELDEVHHAQEMNGVHGGQETNGYPANEWW